MFTTLFEIVWEMTRKINLFDIRKHYDVAIDYTEWYFYGDRGAPMVVGKEPEKGTSKCYKFITLNIVEAGKRFTLLALPVGPFDTKEGVLKKLLSYALERIKIRHLLVDRGFCDSNVIKVFTDFHLKYLMPATRIPTVKNILEIAPAPSIIKDFVMKDVTFNLVIVEEEKEDGTKEKRAFATNEEYNENDVNLADRLFDLYGRRWGIETSYRVTKYSFFSRTTSKNYRIRFFYFMFSVLLYNLWILIDILIWLALFGVIKEKHLLKARYFGTVWYLIDAEG
jgi:putative transposase